MEQLSKLLYQIASTAIKALLVAVQYIKGSNLTSIGILGIVISGIQYDKETYGI